MDFRRVSIFLLGVICFTQSSEAAVTAWTAPSPGISGNADGNIMVAGTIAENSDVGTTLFTSTATVDSGGTVSYDLTTNAAGKGTIDSSTGAVTLATDQSIDFETTPTLLFVIEATDSVSGTGTASITLTITDVNEAPAFSSAATTVCLNDNSTAGTTLGTYTATDPDADDTITYSIASGDTKNEFTIGDSTGVINVATGKTLSKATTPSYTLVVSAVDKAGISGSTTISATVGDCSGNSGGGGTNTDGNKAPVFSSGSFTACIKDNSAAGTTLGTYTATDPDAGNTITYSIASTGNTNTDFAVNDTTGVITVATGKTISKDRTATYKLVVNATDSPMPHLNGSTTVSVTVGDCSGTGVLTALVFLMFGAVVATQLL